jgi:hypothetical protein
MAIKKFDKADLNKDGKVTVQEQILAAIGTYGLVTQIQRT